MTDASGLRGPAESGAVDAQANRLLMQVKTQAGATKGGAPEAGANIENYARDFESILLGSW